MKVIFRYLIIVSLVFSAKFLIAQNPYYEYEAQYQHILKPKEGTAPPPGAENHVENIKKIPIIVQFNSEQAHYFVDFQPTNFGESIAAISVGRMTEFFYKRDGALVMKKSRHGNVSYIRDPLQIEWEIDPEKTTTINGMECRWARGELTSIYYGDYEVYAWFTNEVPVPFGPFGAGGLPGLILQFRYKNRTFNLIRLENISDKKIKTTWPQIKTKSVSEYVGESEDMESFLESLDESSRKKIEKRLKEKK